MTPPKLERKISLGNILTIISMVVLLIGFAIRNESQVKDNTEKNIEQDGKIDRNRDEIIRLDKEGAVSDERYKNIQQELKEIKEILKTKH